MNDDEIQVIIDLLDSYRISLDNVLYKNYQPAELTEELRRINRSVDLLETLHSGDLVTIKPVPVVKLEGSDDWTEAYSVGPALERAFPGEDAGEFAYALSYNDYGPIKRDYSNLLTLTCKQFGERDNGSWIWDVTLLNEAGEVEAWTVEGWCDFTGWDCQSSVSWSKR